MALEMLQEHPREASQRRVVPKNQAHPEIEADGGTPA